MDLRACQPDQGSTSHSRRHAGIAQSWIFLSQRLDPAEQVFLARHSCYLIPQLAILEEQQRWNGANVVLKREALVLIDVDFRDFDGIGFFAGDFIEQRRD